MPGNAAGRRRRCPGLLLICAWVAPAMADIYVTTLPDGTELYSDQATHADARLLLRSASPAAGGSARQLTAGALPFAGEIARVASLHDVDPLLLHALVSVESAYRPDAVSAKGAMGLMQLMPATARQLGVTDPFDPQQNLEGGTRHLRRLLLRFEQNLELALAAYNAGAGRVDRHAGRMPPFAETAAYVPRVLQRYARLRDAP
jgi:soluble lytic murein transglycosylase-like protein